MLKIKLLIINCLISVPCAFAQNDVVYKIAPFYEFRKGAISFTFDDGTNSQFRIARKILDEANIKATYYVTTNFMGPDKWQWMREMVKNGHEIGSHTLNHPKWLSTIPLDSAQREISKSKATIESKIPNYKCLTFCYPYGAFNKDIKKIVTNVGYIGARSTKVGYEKSQINDYNQLRTLFFDGDGFKNTSRLVDSAIVNNLWLIEGYHGFDNEGLGSCSSVLFRRHLEYVNTKSNELWITTLGDAMKYFRQKDAIDVTLLQSLEDRLSVRITCSLDTSIYNHPLTFSFLVPCSWNSIYAITKQNDTLVSYNSTDEFGNKFVVFNSTPNCEIEIISKKNDDLCSFDDIVKIFPNPFSNRLSLDFNYYQIVDELKIVDIKGKSVYYTKDVTKTYEIDTSNWERGLYSLQLKLKNLGSGQLIIKKLIKTN